MSPAAPPTASDDDAPRPDGEEGGGATATLRSLAGISEFQDHLLALVREHGYDDSAQFAVRLAVEEALANAVRYGKPEERGEAVRITYQVSGERIWIRIADPGPGFNPAKVPDPTSEERLDLPAGRGILIMRAFMTEVRYNEQGNEVTLVYQKPDAA